MMIVEENAEAFALTKRSRKAGLPGNPVSAPCSAANNYGLQLAATLLSDERSVAAGDEASQPSCLSPSCCQDRRYCLQMGQPAPVKKCSQNPFTIILSVPKHHLWRSIAQRSWIICSRPFCLGTKGAFTGASTAKWAPSVQQMVARAFDEISEMPMPLQAVTGSPGKSRYSNWFANRNSQLMCASAITNRNMAEEIRVGNFCEDLHYRLNVFPLNTVALAERIDDIVPVATFLLERHVKTAASMPWLDHDAIKSLRGYGWPGNVRELENVLQRALVLAENGVITASNILIDNALEPVGEGPQRTMIDAFRQSVAQA